MIMLLDSARCFFIFFFLFRTMVMAVYTARRIGIKGRSIAARGRQTSHLLRELSPDPLFPTSRASVEDDKRDDDNDGVPDIKQASLMLSSPKTPSFFRENCDSIRFDSGSCTYPGKATSCGGTPCPLVNVFVKGQMKMVPEVRILA